MKILNLTLKKKWFDMILSGSKTQEYREVKDYWCNIFCQNNWHGFDIEVLEHAINKHYDLVRFRHGYAKNAREMTIECKSVTVNKGKEEWGAEKGEYYFVIDLGALVSTKNIKP